MSGQDSTVHRKTNKHRYLASVQKFSFVINGNIRCILKNCLKIHFFKFIISKCLVCCVWQKVFWEKCNTYFYSQQLVRDPETNQSMDTANVKFDEPMSFTRITYQSISDSKAAGATPAWVTTHKSWETWGKQHSLHAVHQVGECPLPNDCGLDLFPRLSWFLLLPDIWPCLRVFAGA